MFSFSLNDIVSLFQGTSLIYLIIIFIIGAILGFSFAKALHHESEKNMKDFISPLMLAASDYLS